MKNMETILNEYKSGNLHTRLNLFCHYRFLRDQFQEIEKKTITDVLNETGGDKTKAAKKLGIGLRTLYRKIEKWGLDG